MNWSWPNFRWLGLAALGALLLMGQSCTISLGGTGADGGIWRSADHGQTWQTRNFVRQQKKSSITLAEVTVRALVLEPGQPQHLFLGTLANGVWRSLDDGAHWQPTSLRSGDYQCLDFDPSNHDIMYTASGSFVMKSLDAAATWSVIYTESQPGQGVNCVVVNPTDGRFIWAFTSGGKIIGSDDYGQSWTLRGAVPPLEPRRIWVDPKTEDIWIFSRNNGIFLGQAHGTSWQNVRGNLGTWPGALDIRSVAIHPSGWYLGTAYGLLRSVDHGQTWTVLHTLVTPGSVAIQDIAINPQTSQDMFIVVGQKLHHTIDGGASWSVSTLPTSRIPVLLTFQPDHPDVLYFGTFKPTKK